MNRTKIEYLTHTWNPYVGCTGQSCAVRDHCWAIAMAKRLKKKCAKCGEFVPHLHPERLKEPLFRKKPARIGVCFMGDLFDSSNSISWVQDIFRTMEKASQHTFLVLTKQTFNLLNCTVNWIDVPKNVWLGVTVNRKNDTNRIEDLKTVDSDCVKFVSFEPLYEDMGDIDLKGIEWVIIGAQTRPTFQPELDWVNDLIKQARSVGAAVFLKNNLGYVHLLEEAGLRHRLQEFPK